MLKQKITKALVLTLLDVERPFTIFTNPSGVAIRAILTQDGRVVAYDSRKMNEIEQRCPIYEQELLAVIHAIKIWKHYWKNNEFKVVTDHKPLLSFLPKAELGSTQYKWAMVFK